MKKILLLILLLPLIVLSQDAFSKNKAQQPTTDPTIVNISENIEGTLLVPDNFDKIPLVIIIGDQGAIDRNGNDRRTKNNAYQQLADSLLSYNIASYRYDKRMVTQLKNRKPSDNILFTDFITDAKQAIEYLKKNKRFSKIFIAGHGQGSLVGMLALDNKVAGFISINGAAQTIDDLIVQQIAKEIPGLDQVAAATFKKVKASSGIVNDIERDLYTVIGPQLQPFMKSWMQYHPAEEIKNLQVPILIINGSKNRQVAPSEATLLKKASPSAQLEIIKNMNHVLKIVGDDEIEAAKSYINPQFPLSSELVRIITAFVAD
jgi:alpha-beta hydrolase superfamily lysophospholipase